MKKIIIDGIEFYTVSEACQYIQDNMSDEYFDNDIDACYGEIEVCGIKFDASYVLYKCDPIAYRCYKSDYGYNIEDDIITQLEQEESKICGFDVEYEEIEEDGE